MGDQRRVNLWNVNLLQGIRFYSQEDVFHKWGYSYWDQIATKICVNNERQVSKFRLNVHLANEIKWYEMFSNLTFDKT